MWKIIYNRFKQGHRPFKAKTLNTLSLPPAFRGRPTITTHLPLSSEEAKRIAALCPQEAIADNLALDLAKCTFCGECTEDPSSPIQFSNEFRMAATSKRDLILTNNHLPIIEAKKIFKELFGRSLQLRHLSAGSCNACELDLNVLNTPYFDLARFGIQLVASPRHADGLIISGPVTKAMREALLLTYQAIPDPKVVIAVGSCALSGGPFFNSLEVEPAGVDGLVPVDLYIPGCPPHPLTILDGLIRYFKGDKGDKGASKRVS